MPFDVDSIRKDFPILNTLMNKKHLAYLDSAATSQKPIQVIDAISNFYKTYNANIHRGIYQISERATEEYTKSKQMFADLINANSWREIVYVRNATEALNLAAISWGGANVKRGDHILISEMEHHSNLVPWLVLSRQKGAKLDYIKVDPKDGTLDMNSFLEQIEKQPKIVAVTQASNVLGTINDVKRISAIAHKAGAKILLDGAQSVPHMKVDVKEIGCDFLAFSGHKRLGPTGIGVLYAKDDILAEMEPLFTGGDMIRSVEFHDSTWNDLPWKFEAGTPNIEGAIAMNSAIEYINKIGINNIHAHEKKLVKYALGKMNDIRGVKTFGGSADDLSMRGGVISFAIKGIHPHDVSQIFDSQGIAIRAGHHCAMPLVTSVMREPALSRMSFYLYNTEEEIDRAIDAIGLAQKIFRVE